MRKTLILLAIATIAANSIGCCCRRLCPWLDRGASCCPLLPSSAPLVASPAPVCCPPTTQQFVTPLAAPVAAPMAAPVAASPCVAPSCTYWDPCQNAVVAQPLAAQTRAIVPQQPIIIAPSMTSFAEPGCGFAMEPACGEPFMGEVSYGPSFSSDCDTCSTGGEVSEGTFSAPAPESFQKTDPTPMAE